MELFLALIAAIGFVAVGSYFWGKSRAKAQSEQAQKKELHRVIDTMKKTDVDIKKLSDDDIDKFI